MKLARTTHFLRVYQRAPEQIQRTFDKQAMLFEPEVLSRDQQEAVLCRHL